MARSTESSQQEKLISYTREGTEKLTPEMEQEIRELVSRSTEEDFNDADFPSEAHLGEPVIGKFYKPLKKPVTLRIDADILAWYKAHFKPYQRKMNEILRNYAENASGH